MLQQSRRIRSAMISTFAQSEQANRVQDVATMDAFFSTDSVHRLLTLHGVARVGKTLFLKCVLKRLRASRVRVALVDCWQTGSIADIFESARIQLGGSFKHTDHAKKQSMVLSVAENSVGRDVRISVRMGDYKALQSDLEQRLSVAFRDDLLGIPSDDGLTVLIFDHFERSPVAFVRWVNSYLLPSLIHAEGLRVLLCQADSTFDAGPCQHLWTSHTLGFVNSATEWSLYLQNHCNVTLPDQVVEAYLRVSDGSAEMFLCYVKKYLNGVRVGNH